MNSRKGIYIVAGVVAVLLIVLFWHKDAPADYKNVTYTIDGKAVTLHDGVSEVAQAGSVAKVVTRYFGNEAKGDLNGDGIPDLAFLLTQTTGGSGTFYYLVGAVQTADGEYRGTDGVLLGDRIAPQTTEVSQNPNHKNVIVVNYADRAPGEPMTAQPSVGKSLYLKLDPATMQFGIVVQDFEGETGGNPQIPVDSAAMNVTLTGTYVCLPFLDSKTPPSEECVFGLKTDDGVYYMVNFGQSASAKEQFDKRTHITAEGFVVPKEALSTNHFVPLNMKGIFTITKFLE